MSNIDSIRVSNIKTRPGPKVGNLRTFTLADEDCQHLHRHLQQPGLVKRSFLDHVLRHKVQASRAPSGAAPHDVVTGTSFVRYAIDGGPVQTGLLSHWARSGARSGVIPVCSLLGAALIGMRKGERAPLLNEDGSIAALAVLDVSPSG